MAHHTRGQQKVQAKTPAMTAFENEVRDNIKKLRPELSFISIQKLDDGQAWVTLHDSSRTPSFIPLKLEAPVGIGSGPYTHKILAALDVQLALTTPPA